MKGKLTMLGLAMKPKMGKGEEEEMPEDEADVALAEEFAAAVKSGDGAEIVRTFKALSQC